MPPEERIATFDQDGTLWVEYPMYTQVIYCLDRVPAVVKAKPELANVEPFKTVMSGDREAIAKLPDAELYKILPATLSGMSVDDFRADVKKWLATARDPRWKRPYTELAYLPMVELLKYLRASGYRTYIVTGGGQDFVRVFAEQVYGIPPEQVVGTAEGTTFGYDKNGKPFLTKDPKLLLERQLRGQAGGHSSDDRPPAARRLRQLDRRSANARIHRCRRRRPARRCSCCTTTPCANTPMVPAQGLPEAQGGHVHAGALRRGDERGLDGDQHEAGLETSFCI